MSQDWSQLVDPSASPDQAAFYRRVLVDLVALPDEAFTTPPDKALCYSGPRSPAESNHDKALRYARLHDLVPIDFTRAGLWLDHLNLYAGNSVTHTQATWLWSALSARYMAQAKGTLTAFVEGHSPDRIFSRVELKAFVENPHLNGIQYLDLDSRKKLVWIAREFLEKAARDQGLTHEAAVLHSSSPARRIPNDQLHVYDLSFPIHRLLSSVIGKSPPLSGSIIASAQLERERIYRLEQIRLLYKAGQADTTATKQTIERVLNIHHLPSGPRKSLGRAIDHFLDGPVGSEELVEIVREVRLARSGHMQILRGRSKAPLSNPIEKPPSLPRKEPLGPNFL